MSSPEFVDRFWRSRDGLTLHARDYLAAPGPARLPVICIHGLTRNARDFEDLAPWLAQRGHRVFAVDVRGRGLSQYDPVPENYNPTTYARDILTLFDELGIGRAIFIGTSMGGLITLIVAGQRLGCIAGAILNDVGPEVSRQGLDRIMSYAGKSGAISDWPGAVDYVKQVMGAAFPSLPESRWPILAARTFSPNEEGRPCLDYDRAIVRQFGGKPPSRRSIIGWLLFPRLARRRPTLLLRGGVSDLLSPEIAAKMCRMAPQMEFAEVPGVGHAPLLDEPEALEIIQDFLGRFAPSVDEGS